MSIEIHALKESTDGASWWGEAHAATARLPTTIVATTHVLGINEIANGWSARLIDFEHLDLTTTTAAAVAAAVGIESTRLWSGGLSRPELAAANLIKFSSTTQQRSSSM